MITVLHEQKATALADAAADGDSLWLGAAGIEAATGWQWKPEGLCHGDTCVPLPPGAASRWVRQAASGSQLDIAALWQHSGQPVAHDDAGTAWVLGSGAAQRSQALATLEAPDFELPDLDGRLHRLSASRGRKVFLFTWASW